MLSTTFMSELCGGNRKSVQFIPSSGSATQSLKLQNRYHRQKTNIPKRDQQWWPTWFTPDKCTLKMLVQTKSTATSCLYFLACNIAVTQPSLLAIITNSYSMIVLCHLFVFWCIACGLGPSSVSHIHGYTIFVILIIIVDIWRSRQQYNNTWSLNIRRLNTLCYIVHFNCLINLTDISFTIVACY